MSEVLVACFSASGATKEAGKKIAKAAGGDFFEIVPKQAYSSADLDWTNPVSRSSVEMKDPKARPEIDGKVENMDSYDVVFVGYPIWWGLAPRIIDTFLESYDFSGKTVVPFCTSGGSGVGKSDAALHSDAGKDVRWVRGKLVSRLDEAEIKKWISGILR